MNCKCENIYVRVQGLQLIISKIDNDSTLDTLNLLSPTLLNLRLNREIIQNPYAFPYWMQLFSKFLTPNFGHTIAEFVCGHFGEVKRILFFELEKFDEIEISAELEKIDEFKFHSVLLGYCKSALICDDSGSELEMMKNWKFHKFKVCPLTSTWVVL